MSAGSALELLLSPSFDDDPGATFARLVELGAAELEASLLIAEISSDGSAQVRASSAPAPERLDLSTAPWPELLAAKGISHLPTAARRADDRLPAAWHPGELWIVPVRSRGGALVGLVLASSTSASRHDAPVRAVLAAVALRVQLLFEEKTRHMRLTRQVELATSAVSIGELLDVTTADLVPVLEKLCAELCRVLEVTAAAVTLLDPERAQFIREAQVGLPRAWLEFHPPQAQVEHFEAHASLWSPIAVFDRESLGKLPVPALYAELDLRTIMQSVLRHEGRAVGMLSVLSFGHDRSFSEDERIWFQGIGHRVAQAVRTARLTRKIAASEARYRQMIEGCLEGVWVIDAHGKVAFANQPLAQMLGYQRDEMVGRSALDFMGETAHAEARMRFERRRQGIAERRQFRLRHRDGHELWVVLASNPVMDERGQFAGVVGFVTDLTERHRLEQKVQQAQKIESLGLLAGGLAHDFNNLLTTMLGNASLARLDIPPTSPAHGSLVAIEKAAERAAELTRQMLAYAGKAERRIQAVAVNDVTRDTLDLLQPAVGKNTTLVQRLDDSVPLVAADSTQLRQIVMNLVTNADEALQGRPGTITISSGAIEADREYLDTLYIDQMLDEGTYVYLEVQDTGCGMNAPTQARLFDPFFSTKFAGRGLGMASVLGILRAHRGAIRVESTPGQGSTFRVLLPPASERTPRATTPTPQPVGRSASARATVMVVDDEIEVGRVSRRALEREGFQVLTATNGEEAVELFRRHQDEVKAVVLDLTMPGPQGDEVLRRLRALRPTLPILLCSGYDEQDVRGRIGGHEGVGFLLKPFTLSSLLAAVRRVLQTAPA